MAKAATKIGTIDATRSVIASATYKARNRNKVKTKTLSNSELSLTEGYTIRVNNIAVSRIKGIDIMKMATV